MPTCHRVTQTYPDIDCLFLNAGVQGSYDFSEPEKVDLKAFFAEFNLNFTSLVTLTHAFLPFLQSKKTQTSLIL
jgi:short-subunit dehydrogenase involved in D-alanine esterification of teichoic acids